MLSKISEYQRVGVFVDVQNMFYSAKYLNNAKLNFIKLMEKAVRGRQLIRAICYCVDTPDADQTQFLEMLKNNGYEIKMREVRNRADGSSKADWDMGIAIDVVSLAEKLDVIVLVSGDGDFAELVYYLKSRGVLVEAISFLGSTNETLIKAVNTHIPIEKDLLLKPSGPARSSYSRQSKDKDKDKDKIKASDKKPDKNPTHSKKPDTKTSPSSKPASTSSSTSSSAPSHSKQHASFAKHLDVGSSPKPSGSTLSKPTSSTTKSPSTSTTKKVLTRASSSGANRNTSSGSSVSSTEKDKKADRSSGEGSDTKPTRKRYYRPKRG